MAAAAVLMTPMHARSTSRSPSDQPPPAVTSRSANSSARSTSASGRSTAELCSAFNYIYHTHTYRRHVHGRHSRRVSRRTEKVVSAPKGCKRSDQAERNNGGNRLTKVHPKTHTHTQQFTAIIRVNMLHWQAPPVKNWRILLKQILLATCPSDGNYHIWIRKKIPKSPKSCYLYCLCTICLEKGHYTCLCPYMCVCVCVHHRVTRGQQLVPIPTSLHWICCILSLSTTHYHKPRLSAGHHSYNVIQTHTCTHTHTSSTAIIHNFNFLTHNNIQNSLPVTKQQYVLHRQSDSCNWPSFLQSFHTRLGPHNRTTTSI